MSVAIAAALATISVAAALSASIYWRRSRRLASRIRELEESLKASVDKAAFERRGRTRAQQALRDSLVKKQSGGVENGNCASYPMVPIGTVQSCFTTRNGTPRQPLLVPLARACLMLNPSRAPADTLLGLHEYSHCWILYVFHLNTDLEKLWKDPYRSKFKSKVRVPRLKGGKMGVLATRSPHRPCPIGLTVAMVEAVVGHAILLSGIDLVDGTPILDIKPYLPYSDCIYGATVPKWLEDDKTLMVASVCFSTTFPSSLAKCWETVGPSSMYASPDEVACLIKQVLSWDIKSFSQRIRPHQVGTISTDTENNDDITVDQNSNSCNDAQSLIDHDSGVADNPPNTPAVGVTYHLALEGIDITYRIDDDSNVTVENATLCGKNSMRDPIHFRKWK